MTEQRVWRIVRWLLTAGGIVLGAAGILVVALIVRDEAPSADALALMQAPAQQYSDADNLHVLLAGMDAPAGADPVNAGRARIDAYRQAALQAPQATDSTQLPNLIESPRVEVTGDVPAWSPLDSSIWDQSRSRQVEIPTWVAANRVLFDRYEALRDAKGYQEAIIRGGSWEPFYSVPARLRALYLASIAHIGRAVPDFDYSMIADFHRMLRISCLRYAFGWLLWSGMDASTSPTARPRRLLSRHPSRQPSRSTV